ncbi:MAG TPA: hypothetical protein VFW87_25500 [Pirellulales bacterium]|nr:hypothetical protein [Pirellulales bacterium]
MMLRLSSWVWAPSAIMFSALLAAPATPAAAQATRGPRDYFDPGNQRDRVFDGRVYDDPYRGDGYSGRAADDDAYDDSDDWRGRPRSSRARTRYDSNDESFSEAYPYLPPPRSRTQREADEDNDDRRPRTPSRPATRYRRHSSDYVERNDYAGAPVYRHYYGGVDRYDSPGYLDDAGRASALSNGYSHRGVEQYRDAYGRGVRTNDVYPLQRNVNPRRWRGRDLNGSVAADDEDTSGAEETEDLIRKELSVRPGANLRVSSTGTYTFRNYLDQGNQVHARFRLPVHKRWEYGRGP